MAIYSSNQAANNSTAENANQVDAWVAWPGGKTTTSLNPEEEFTSENFDLIGDVNWDVGSGGVSAIIVSASDTSNTNLTPVNATTVSGKNRIRVRYDNVSPSSIETDTVKIVATDGNTTTEKKRTIFSVSLNTVNTSSQLHPKNKLLFDLYTGIDQNIAGVNEQGHNDSKVFVAKSEIIFSITPNDIEWRKTFGKTETNNMGVNFIFDHWGSEENQKTRNKLPSKKFDCVARRQRNWIGGQTSRDGQVRVHEPKSIYFNVFYNDGEADTTDAHYPDNSQREFIFRIDVPNGDPIQYLNYYLRINFREFIEFYNGDIWIRITEYAEWFANLGFKQTPTGVIADPPNAMGSGSSNIFFPNTTPTVSAGQDFQANQGEEVALNATGNDLDYDDLKVDKYEWTQISGAPVTNKKPSDLKNKFVSFTVPNVPGDIEFQVIVKDSTEGLPRSPGNFQSAPDIIKITVV